MKLYAFVLPAGLALAVLVPGVPPAASFHGNQFVFCDYDLAGSGDQRMIRTPLGLASDGFADIGGCFWDTPTHPVGPLFRTQPFSHVGSGPVEPFLVNHGPDPGRLLGLTPDAVFFVFAFDFILGTFPPLLFCTDQNDDHICGDSSLGEAFVPICGGSGAFAYPAGSVHVGVFVIGPRYAPFVCPNGGNLVGGVMGTISVNFA